MVSFECACRASDLGGVGQLPGYCLAVLAEIDRYPDNYHCFVVTVCRPEPPESESRTVSRSLSDSDSVGLTRTSCHGAVLNYSGYCGVAVQVVPGI
jgi:hypothetical protein